MVVAYFEVLDIHVVRLRVTMPRYKSLLGETLRQNLSLHEVRDIKIAGTAIRIQQLLSSTTLNKFL
jgi:hypothetical protein